ncbi:MAG TPA: LPS export ABC transporter periplasmic protein LptC [Rhizomicrobium sp.]|jgi:lipopolysaccharide export system protein LptC|nr:LPS export ABC transporter periplasmic protein LptC [Rhizomicrobium sp.]
MMAETTPLQRHPVRDWTARTRSSFLDAQRYSRFVTIMKRALPIAAFALIAAIVAYSLQPRQQNRVEMTFESVNQIDNDLAMIKPRLTGADDKGNPFVITADRAIQLGRNSHRARLENVEADLTLQDSQWLNASAPGGLFDGTKAMLALNGGVSVFSDSGYEFHTPTAEVELRKGIVSGNQPVVGQGPTGTMRADRFRLNKITKLIYLEGHVHMTYLQSKNLRGEVQ